MSNEQPPPSHGYGEQPGERPGEQPGGYPGQQMPSYPAPPPPYGQATASVEQPASIQTAVRLMWVGAALSVISLIVGLIAIGGMKDEIRNQLQAQGQQVTQSAVDAAFTVGILFGVVFGIIGVLLWLWMAWKNGQGRSWARIVATVLGVIYLISTIINLSSSTSSGFSKILGVITLIVDIVILVLLYRKESSDFYKGRSTRGAYA
ncbi:MAG TPA: hypothetical protein VFJ19_19850 [Nocardioidaceae bacterium]|nr:hypothetical protein [Nocardioidaceae bacterium]